MDWEQVPEKLILYDYIGCNPSKGGLFRSGPIKQGYRNDLQLYLLVMGNYAALFSKYRCVMDNYVLLSSLYGRNTRLVSDKLELFD